MSSAPAPQYARHRRTSHQRAKDTSEIELAEESHKNQQSGVADRYVAFLGTLVVYPYLYLYVQQLAHETAVPDVKTKLSEFAEGRAILNLERWCKTPVFFSITEQLIKRYAQLVRAIILRNIAENSRLRQYLLHPRLLQLAAAPPDDSLEEIVAWQLLEAPAIPTTGDIAAPLQEAIVPIITYIKGELEKRVVLRRGRTWLEASEVFLDVARYAIGFAFTWLRFFARLANYTSSLIGVVSSALSFTVIFSVVLSIVAAGLALLSLAITGVANMAEPLLLSTLNWTRKGTEQVHIAADRKFGFGEAVGPRRLPRATVEELETFFDTQVVQTVNLVNRPEVPRLARDRLLVKLYDLGVIDADGDVQLAGVRWLRKQRPGLGPFRKDGFFAYAPRLQVKAGITLLLRLVCWKRVNLVLAGDEALRYLSIAGGPNSGKELLVEKLLVAGGPLSGANGSNGGDGRTLAPAGAVKLAAELQPVVGLDNLYAAVFRGLDSSDEGVRQTAQQLVQTIVPRSAAFVLVVPFGAAVEDPDLQAVLDAMSAGVPSLVCLNRSAEFIAPSGTPLSVEEVKQRVKSALDYAARERGVDSRFVTVVATDFKLAAVTEEEPALAGLQGFSQVYAWILKTARSHHRAV